MTRNDSSFPRTTCASIPMHNRPFTTKGGYDKKVEAQSVVTPGDLVLSSGMCDGCAGAFEVRCRQLSLYESGILARQLRTYYFHARTNGT